MIEAAKWIACAADAEAPVIEKRFTLSGPSSGCIEVTGLGYFVLYLNGRRISPDRLVPAVSDYEPRDTAKLYYPIRDRTTHRIYYLRYDIGAFLKEGENTLQLALGNGWYRQHLRAGEGDTSFSDELKALFAAEIVCADGSRTRVLSDGTETYTGSLRTFDCLFIGEIQDARLRNAPKTARPVRLCPPPPAVLTLQETPADRVLCEKAAVCISQDGDRRIYDVGENISGWVQARVQAAPGTRLVLRFSEELLPDGGLDFGSAGSHCICTDGRPQIQQDEFICSGGEDVFTPEFVFHTFRYFEASGPGAAFTVQVVHADVPVSSSFECSDATLSWLYDAFVRTQLDNMHGGIPSDCPHRERLGYTGDGQAVCETALLLLDSRLFYAKWLQDILDCQGENGHVQHTAPLMGGGGGPGGWGCAVALVPCALYRFTGDRGILRQSYPAVRKWIGYLETRGENGLVTREEEGGWCLGDWAMLGEVQIPPEYVNTCYFVRVLRLAADMALQLGFPDEAAGYAAEAGRVSGVLCRKYFDAETGSFCGGVQGADAFALYAELNGDPRVYRNLVRRYERLGIFDTGFLATEILTDLLIRGGDAGLAFRLITGREKGGFGYMKNAGATTVWEYLSGRASHCHPMFGALTRHLFDGFLGITQQAGTAGYRHLVIEPHLPEQLACARGSVTVPAGRVVVGFERSGGRVAFTLELPPCDSAVFRYGGETRTLQPGSTSFCL